MKFEAPKMNISIFGIENVITSSTDLTNAKNEAVDVVNEYLSGQGEGAQARSQILTFTF
ncbi:MAG: hypothetical protein IJH94_03945 [Clostridia bacterium]|nr:hypothetical protein [Clostridia bacterium]